MIGQRIKRKLSWVLKYWAWRLAGSPKSTAVPLYHEGKLVAYDEFLLNQVGEMYIETFDDEGKSIRRRVYLFDTKVLDEEPPELAVDNEESV